MEDPSLLTQETLPELKQLVECHPCFAIARMLYLKNLFVSDETRFRTALNKMAVYLPDRKKLFFLIEGARYGLDQIMPATEAPVEADDSFSLIDAFLSDYAEEHRDVTEQHVFTPSVSSDYLYWSQKNEPEEDREQVPLQHQDLIDSFIQKEAENPLSAHLRFAEMKKTDVSPDLSEKSLGDSFFTETLAHIYVKQRRYDKALQIIKNLSLKYPEKNIYFADQIRFLEKLIINTKK